MKGKEKKCKESNNHFHDRREKILLSTKNKIFHPETKNDSVITLSKNKNKILKNNDNKLKEKREKILKSKNMENFIVNKNFAVIVIFKILILTNIISCLKFNFLDFYLFQCSSNISLKIKGIGENYILGYQEYRENILHNHPKEVYINGNKQDDICKKYYFNETNNYVELIFDDNVDDCFFMFGECSSITEINFSNFDTSFVTSMSSMFKNCISLTSLDLSNFNTSLVKDVEEMFLNCLSLTSLNLSNFDTSKVEFMDAMFANCSSLISLDLSNFNTSLVTDMNYMFFNCSSLTSLDLSNFDTSQVIEMVGMFFNCSSLISLDLSNFDTSQVIEMVGMFCGCSSLTSLDLSSFDTSQVTSAIGLFSSCSFLILLDSDDFNISQALDNFEFLDSCINLEYINIYNFNDSGLIDYDFMFLGVPENIVICMNTTQQKIFSELEKKSCYVIDCSNDWKSKQKKIFNNSNICIDSCDNRTQYEYNGKCYEKNGNYTNDDLHKNCYHTCKTCDFEGNNLIHNCIECNENFSFGIEINKYFNCYENCNFYYYFDKENNFYCTMNANCPNEYPLLLENKKECIKPEKAKEEEIKYYDNILKNIDEEFISDDFNTSNIDRGEDKIINNEKITITLTTSQNQRNNININRTRIDLGECEILLRKFYNISDNESLYIKKIDISQESMKTLKVEYDVYAKLFGKNLIKLNLTICENSKISISIPIIINEHLDKLNISSGYYNDICYTTTSEDGTDILLKDRQNEFIDKNKIVCQEDCDFSDYDYNTFVAKCSCKVKECSNSFADMNINKSKLFENFKNIKNIINFNFLVCYKNLFDKEGIINNIGSYLLIFIILFHIITIFIFRFKQFSSLINIIKNIISEVYEFQAVKKIEIDRKIDKLKKKELNDKKIIINKKSNKKIGRNKKIKNQKEFNESKINFNLKIKKNINDNKGNNKKYIDEEINGLSYDLAIQYDKRTYCQYYSSLLKTQHSLICALFNKNDYNCRIIKINLFLIGFTIDYTVNALFYNDDTMHKIYESKGDFDLETQLPIAVYSTIISTILNYPLNILALSMMQL